MPCSNSFFHTSVFKSESKLKPSSMPTRPLTRASKLTVPCPFLSKSLSRPSKSQTKLPHGHATKIPPPLVVCNVFSELCCMWTIGPRYSQRPIQEPQSCRASGQTPGRGLILPLREIQPGLIRFKKPPEITPCHALSSLRLNRINGFRNKANIFKTGGAIGLTFLEQADVDWANIQWQSTGGGEKQVEHQFSRPYFASSNMKGAHPRLVASSNCVAFISFVSASATIVQIATRCGFQLTSWRREVRSMARCLTLTSSMPPVNKWSLSGLQSAIIHKQAMWPNAAAKFVLGLPITKVLVVLQDIYITCRTCSHSSDPSCSHTFSACMVLLQTRRFVIECHSGKCPRPSPSFRNFGDARNNKRPDWERWPPTRL